MLSVTPSCNNSCNKSEFTLQCLKTDPWKGGSIFLHFKTLTWVLKPGLKQKKEKRERDLKALLHVTGHLSWSGSHKI